MNKLIKLYVSVLSGILLFAGCENEPEYFTTDVGPQMTVKSYTEDVYMGASVKFSIDLQDAVPLSTLKASLLFDDTEVSNVTIRTRETGVYDSEISVPLLADIPDGVASLVFSAQNTGLGITTETVYVNVARPDFDEMSLVVDGKSYRMEKTGSYVYSATDNFPASASATVVSPAVNDDGDVITIGWDGSALAADGRDPIPFAVPRDGVYTVEVDLMNLTASPLGNISVTLTETEPAAVVNLLQECTVDFNGINDISGWDLDFDFFRLEDDNTVTFKAIDGLYRLTADFSSKFVKVEAMADRNSTATLSDDGSGAVWMIGANFGKPVIGPSWNTTEGAYCLSQINPKIHQITLAAGASIAASGYSVKFYGEKGWGGEFGKSAYSAVNGSVDGVELIKVVDSGNIEPAEGASLELGVYYTFTLDLTAGRDAAVLDISVADVPVASLDIRLNGAQAMRLTSAQYNVPVVALAQNEEIQLSGVDDFSSYNIDPDYFRQEDGKVLFNAIDGNYSVDIYLEKKYLKVKAVKADGSDGTLSDGGALWMMGWGLANPFMDGGQFAFDAGGSSTFCMAQVSPMVFRLTGKAVEEKDGTTMWGRFRYDYISGKYFAQNGWGDEKGKINGTENTVEYTGLAATVFGQAGGDNFGFNTEETDKHLELGATYVLTIDLSRLDEGMEIISLVKE